MADVNVQPVAANANTALAAPPQMLVNYAQSLGIDEDAFTNLYGQLKANNPTLSDPMIAMAIKQYSQQPQTQLQGAMNKEQTVQNALPSANTIKQTFDPSIAQKYADFQKNNNANESLSNNMAMQSDLARAQAGATPEALTNNQNYWNQQRENILKPAVIAQDVQGKQTAALGDLRDQLQKGVADLQSNVGSQIAFESMDPTSQISKNIQQWAIQNKVVTPQQAPHISAAQFDILLKNNADFQKAQSEATTARAALITAQTGAANSKSFNGDQSLPSYAQNPQDNTGTKPAPVASPPQGATVTAPQNKVPMVRTGPTSQEVNPAYSQATGKATDRNQDSIDVLQNAPYEIALLNQAIGEVKKAHTGIGGQLLSKIPDSESAKLQATLGNLLLNRFQSFTKGGGSAGAERTAAFQEIAKNAIGSVSQGPETIIQNLLQMKNKVMNDATNAKAVTQAYGKDPTMSGYIPPTYIPSELHKSANGHLYEVHKDPNTGKIIGTPEGLL